MEEADQADPLPSESSTHDDDSRADQAGPLPSGSSTHDDDSGGEGARTGRAKPWWEGHPELEAIRAGVEAEIYGRPERPESDSPDPVLADYLSGDSVRELRMARDGLAQAKTRYSNAVHAGRTAGLSWAQIGTVLGVARQQLHRRFRDLTEP